MSETVKVILSSDYYCDEYWMDYDPAVSGTGYEASGAVYEVPVEQRDRWQAAMDAHRRMQTEIAEVMAARKPRPSTPQNRAVVSIWSSTIAHQLGRDDPPSVTMMG